RLIGVAVVDRECDGAIGNGITRRELEQLVDGKNALLSPAQVGERATQRCDVVAFVLSRPGNSPESMQHENDRSPSGKRREKRRGARPQQHLQREGLELLHDSMAGSVARGASTGGKASVFCTDRTNERAAQAQDSRRASAVSAAPQASTNAFVRQQESAS